MARPAGGRGGRRPARLPSCESVECPGGTAQHRSSARRSGRPCRPVASRSERGDRRCDRARGAPVPVSGDVTVHIDFQNVLSLFLAILFVILLGLVSNRLIGIKVGRWRSMLTALVGTVVGPGRGRRRGPRAQRPGCDLRPDRPVRGARHHGPPDHPRGHRPHRGRARAAAAPSASGCTRCGGPAAPWPRCRRSFEVLGAARRRGLARPQYLSPAGMATEEFGRRLRLTLEDAGGMFVKFGQIASTRSDLLAAPVVEELSRLRADVRPIPSDEVRPLVEAELGRPVEEVFASFEFEPLAVGLHRAGAPGHARHRRGGGGQGAAARARRPAAPGRHRAAAGRPDRRAPGPGRPRLRRPPAGRGAHHQHGPRARLPARGDHVRPAAGHHAPRRPGRRRGAGARPSSTSCRTDRLLVMEEAPGRPDRRRRRGGRQRRPRPPAGRRPAQLLPRAGPARARCSTPTPTPAT